MSDVLDARKFLTEFPTPTRLVRAESLEAVSGAQVWLKLEIENPTGTFKVRGALNAVRHRSQQSRFDGVVTSSTGNHGAAIAFAARQMNLKSRIYLPENPNPVKRERIAQARRGDCRSGTRPRRKPRARREILTRERLAADCGCGRSLISPPAPPQSRARFSSKQPSTDVIVVPVGDSNLIRGIAFAAKQIRPAIRIIGVQAEKAPAYYQSWKEHRSLSTETADTIADGLATRTTTEDNVRQLIDLVDDIRLVSDEEMLQRHRVSAYQRAHARRARGRSRNGSIAEIRKGICR